MMMLLECVFCGYLDDEIAATVVVRTCSWCRVAVRGRCLEKD